MEGSRLYKLLKIDGLIESLSNYLEDKIELMKLEAKEEIMITFSKLSILLVIILLFLFTLLFSSVVLAIYLSNVLESYLYGFSIVALVYLVLLIVVIFLKKNAAFNKKMESGIRAQINVER